MFASSCLHLDFRSTVYMSTVGERIDMNITRALEASENGSLALHEIICFLSYNRTFTRCIVSSINHSIESGIILFIPNQTAVVSSGRYTTGGRYKLATERHNKKLPWDCRDKLQFDQLYSILGKSKKTIHFFLYLFRLSYTTV